MKKKENREEKNVIVAQTFEEQYHEIKNMKRKRAIILLVAFLLMAFVAIVIR